MISGRQHFLALLSFTTLVLGTQFFQKPNDLPPGVEYDFIIVGGGAAGGVVGARLGEVQDYNILVIEAGPLDTDVFDIQVPGQSQNIWFGSSIDWNYTTSPQTSAGDQVLQYPRAMVLGGCSSHNDMVYNRGSSDDYNRWATFTGDDNLSWENIRPYILKTENWSAPNDPNLSEEGHFDPLFHNENGRLGVTAPYYEHPLNDLLLNATTELSDEYPLLKDLNDGRPIGLGWGQATIARGFRSSSASSFARDSSDNVHILLNSLVARVQPVEGGLDDFRQVELVTDPDSPTWNLTAKKEVIVSGGMINTPQLLLLSGIGPQDELEALGIKTLINNPSVGKNFSDQAEVPLSFSTDLPTNDFDQDEALSQWKSDHTGRLALSRHLPKIGWVRFPPDSPPFKNGGVDPTGGPNSPHVEIFFGGIDPGSGGGNQTLQVFVVDLNTVSRGSITLNTNSPFDQPIINPELLSSPMDIAILLEGFRSVERLLTSATFSKNVFGLTSPQPTANGTLTDDEFVGHIKENSNHWGHGVGSCIMAPTGASWGVVNPEFKVRDVKGLRIVDASVIPFATSGHIQASVYAMAEWASEIIKGSYK